MIEVPLNSQDAAMKAGRKPLILLIDDIRATVACIVQTIENDTVIDYLLNIILALDNFRNIRGKEPFNEWLHWTLERPDDNTTDDGGPAVE